MHIPDRKKLSHDVHRIPGEPTIVFLTVCTLYRAPSLANPEVHDLLCSVWTESTAWLVGKYVILPDRLHLFASPGDPELPLDRWVRYWKAQFTRRSEPRSFQWQPQMFDSRLRRGESYEEKWEYVRNNPVRHGLVANPADWPYQGELNVLEW